MDEKKLSPREAALIAAARREAEARKGTTSPAPSTHQPPAQRGAVQEKPKPGPEERLAQLMADERAETDRRKKKMRRYGIVIPAAIVAIFALWVLRASSGRR